MNFSTLTQQCVRGVGDILSDLQKQAPSANLVGKYAIDQAVREARKVVKRSLAKDANTND